MRACFPIHCAWWTCHTCCSTGTNSRAGTTVKVWRCEIRRSHPRVASTSPKLQLWRQRHCLPKLFQPVCLIPHQCLSGHLRPRWWWAIERGAVKPGSNQDTNNKGQFVLLCPCSKSLLVHIRLQFNKRAMGLMGNACKDGNTRDEILQSSLTNHWVMSGILHSEQMGDRCFSQSFCWAHNSLKR